MELRQTGRAVKTGECRAAWSALLLGFLCALFLFPAGGTSLAAGNGTVLEGKRNPLPRGVRSQYGRGGPWNGARR